ncbi:hypothetical protein [Marinobacter sp. C2H3]|uniref:hypothetical protein n=1 Tax=Marinobacter sp. C2H3 TaxID=3119003 RepID=UPI00300E89AE
MKRTLILALALVGLTVSAGAQADGFVKPPGLEAYQKAHPPGHDKRPMQARYEHPGKHHGWDKGRGHDRGHWDRYDHDRYRHHERWDNDRYGYRYPHHRYEHSGHRHGEWRSGSWITFQFSERLD